MAVLPDVLRPGLRIVFCGTGAGRRSAEVGAYYAKPGNRFWPTLHAVGLTPRQFDPHDFATVIDHDIGLTDVAKAHVGQDSDLVVTDADIADLAMRIGAVSPRYLAFTSKKAASLFLKRPTGRLSYGLQAATLGATGLIVLPSPSGLATSYWTIEPWREAARLARAG
ncbi:mismatch-specific DNA-glycosylase [Bauldia litoralis]|uniref:G/U mismatch-specific uracil-DNA glycosylase n=1 Tax=Bauldia litoralis TaxID=665467 RepID=A0A1G6B5Z5_9HYPH|nr:mismatch-specific DNA-glycosylase [Bauldia litoralis]SDB15979.1 G/U mismatch-specific uracil-DNA glycosylase [Bauldia litoralis]